MKNSIPELSVFWSFMKLTIIRTCQIEGVAHIRAFGWTKQAESANMRSLDRSQLPAYALLCLQRWLGIVLDLMIAAMATSLIALAIYLEGSTTAGQIGMSLNIVLLVNTPLLGLIASWTNMEISLGAMYVHSSQYE